MNKRATAQAILDKINSTRGMSVDIDKFKEHLNDIKFLRGAAKFVGVKVVPINRFKDNPERYIKCDCGHYVDTARRRLRPFITPKGSSKTYVNCGFCKNLLILYKTSDGWYRSTSREDYESGRNKKIHGGPLTDIIHDLRKQGLFMKKWFVSAIVPHSHKVGIMQFAAENEQDVKDQAEKLCPEKAEFRAYVVDEFDDDFPPNTFVSAEDAKAMGYE